MGILRVFQILLNVNLVSLFEVACKDLRRDKSWLAGKSVYFSLFPGNPERDKIICTYYNFMLLLISLSYFKCRYS